MILTSHIEIHHSDHGKTRIEVRLEQNSLWPSEAQIVRLFENGADIIGLHLKSTYQQGELVGVSTTEDASVVRAHYSLADSR